MRLRKHLDDISRDRHAYILALSASMGSVFYGWDTGLIGGVLGMLSFQRYFGIENQSATAQANLNGNIVSILQAGCFFGALSTGYLSGRFGRKRCMYASGVIYIIGSVIQCIVGLGCSQTVGLRVLYFSRFLGGIGVGMVSALVPSYVSECTPRAIRGRCTGLVQFSNNIGIMLGFWVNYGTSLDLPYGDMQWRLPFIVQIIPGSIFLLLILFQPESPRWLVEQGRYEEAAETLAWVARKSADDDAVLLTLEEIKADFAGKEKLSLVGQFRKMCESRVTALRSFLPSLVTFFQQWTGTNAVNYFAPQIFAGLGISSTDSGLFATGVYGLVKVISVGLALAFAVEALGRKRCLIYGALGQGFMMLWIAGYSAIHPQTTIVPASYVSIVAVYIYAIFYCLGWGPVPWVVAAEISPNHVRPAAMSLAVGTNWLFSFLISRFTPNMLDEITYGTFLLFGVFCLIMAVWAYTLLPETKGIALEDIKYLFESDLLVRSLQDAPGGHIFLGSKRAKPVEQLRIAAHQQLDSSIASSGEEDVKGEEKVTDGEVI